MYVYIYIYIYIHIYTCIYQREQRQQRCRQQSVAEASIGSVYSVEDDQFHKLLAIHHRRPSSWIPWLPALDACPGCLPWPPGCWH